MPMFVTYLKGISTFLNIIEVEKPTLRIWLIKLHLPPKAGGHLLGNVYQTLKKILEYWNSYVCRDIPGHSLK